MKSLSYLLKFFVRLIILGISFNRGEAEPPVVIPDELYGDFTFNATIPVVYWYADESVSEPRLYTPELVQTYIQAAHARASLYYGQTDLDLYAALDTYRQAIGGKKVGVIGSVTPWYESILLTYGSLSILGTLSSSL